jgi:hypothetical protein
MKEGAEEFPAVSPWSQEASVAGGYAWLLVYLQLLGSPIRALTKVEPP